MVSVFRSSWTPIPGIDPWLPGEGTEIELPTQYVLPRAPREGVVINLAEYRLYYFPPGANHVITYPVGIGRTEFPTPLIETKIDRQHRGAQLDTDSRSSPGTRRDGRHAAVRRAAGTR